MAGDEKNGNRIRFELRGSFEAPGESHAITAFLLSKRGRRLLKRVVRTDPGRDLVRAIKKEPGGKRALRVLFREDMPKTKRERRTW